MKAENPWHNKTRDEIRDKNPLHATKSVTKKPATRNKIRDKKPATRNKIRDTIKPVTQTHQNP